MFDLRDQPTREQNLWQRGAGIAVVLTVSLLVGSCTVAPLADPASATSASSPPSYMLSAEGGSWSVPTSHAGRKPTGTGTVLIEGVGSLHFDAGQVQTVRPDIFQPGHFSLFDILVYLDEQGQIALDYHFDKSADTHVIDALNGQDGWWYEAYYSEGWPERNVFRMDMYPYKGETRIRVFQTSKAHIANVHRTFQEEVTRLKRNGGQVIIPEVKIQSPRENLTFRDVVVIPHDVRTDVLQPGTVTALDALLSLAERGELSQLKLTWYESIGPANPVDNYWVEQINDAAAIGSCGFVYEAGPREYGGFAGAHIHIPADVRVTLSPEYALWFWICI